MTVYCTIQSQARRAFPRQLIKATTCYGNQIKKLDVTKCPKLIELGCSENKLSEIDVTNCPNLDWFNCSSNQIEKLNVTKCGNLVSLYCYENNLSSINVTKCPNLEYFNCYGNQIEKLDVTKCPKLIELGCSNNKLSEIDVTKCPNLDWFNCGFNTIFELDVTKCTKLTSLQCYNNALDELDVTKCPNLIYLFCYDNFLEKLNLSKCPNLQELGCSRNDIVKLDITKCIKLNWFNCSFNEITELDVTKCPDLVFLYCAYNKLKTLNVTKCSDLKELSCDNNKLSKLNVSKCKELSILECNDNNLYELDAEKCRKISYLNCSNNKLAFLNLNTVLLEFSNIHCENNERSVAVDSNGQFDLSTLKGIDIDSIYLNSGGKLKGNILTFTSEKVKYSYYVCASMETDESEKQPIILSFYLKCDHSAGTVNKVTKATFEKNGVLKKVCDGCGKTIKKSTIYKMEKPKLSKTTYTYNEETKKPSVTVKDSNGKTLKKGTDYTVSYASGRKNPGKYKVTIKGKGKYSGTATKTFTIKPPKVAINSITSSKAKTLKIGWTKSSVVSGYQIYCSTSKDFKKDTVKINRKKGDGTSLTISGLKSGKTYYVKVRTYKLFNDEKIYSSWCKTKSKKIK